MKAITAIVVSFFVCTGCASLASRHTASAPGGQMVVMPHRAIIDFDVRRRPIWTWNVADGTRNRTMEYGWLAEIVTPGQTYEIGFTHFRDPLVEPSSGPLQELLKSGSGHVWCRTSAGGGVALSDIAVQIHATRRGIRTEVRDSGLMRLLFSQRPDSVDLVVTLKGYEQSRHRVPVEYRR